MREIKFRVWLHRGWPGKEHEMAEVDYYFFEEWGYRTSEEVESAGHKLMQYTGLKDKNGKEIYEGDIVEVSFTWGGDYSNEPSGMEVDEYEILWGESGGFELKGGLGSVLNGAPIGASETIEVIGNIYESPEVKHDREQV